MARLSRRHLVAGGLAGASTGLLPGFITAANAAPMTRYNLASPNGQINLKKYAQAVKLMVAMPPSNPLSWTFQWYTHAVPTNTTKAAAITQIFGPNPSPQKALAQAMWDTCQAHFNAADEPYFLPWHRMYVCFFEMIIRKVLNDNTFTLPY
jgi:tyrosinase